VLSVILVDQNLTRDVCGADFRNKSCNTDADTVALVNMYKDQVPNWFLETLAIALAPSQPKPGPSLPRIIDYGDIMAIGGDKLTWLGFENYLTVTDRCELLAGTCVKKRVCSLWGLGCSKSMTGHISG
jgi:hypothetical protein